MALDGFNRIAWIYDGLARFVFAGAINRSQAHFLKFAKPEHTVLILGGGSGFMLPLLLDSARNAPILFVDASSSMIDRARKRVDQDPRVQFIHGTEVSIPAQALNTVITPYFLDMFQDASLQKIITNINNRTAIGAQWIVVDFCSTRRWHRMLLTLMYAFFRSVTGIEADRLPNWSNEMQAAGWHKTESQLFYGNFIEASLWKREV